MVNQKIMDYIKSERLEQYDRETLVSILKGRGYKENEIRGALLYVKGIEIKPKLSVAVFLVIGMMMFGAGVGFFKSTFKAKEEVALRPTWEYYANPELGFSINYPGDWAIDENSEGAVFYSRGATGAGMVVSVEVLDTKMTLDEYLELAKEYLGSQTSDFEIVKTGYDTLDGRDGRVFIYVVRKEETYRMKLKFVFVDDIVYRLTFGSKEYKMDEYIGNLMFDSFQVTS